MQQAVKLDEIDVQILDILQRKGRITNAQLAKEAGLSAPPMLERVKKLERSGVIQGYRAILDPKRLGRAFMVFAAVNLEVGELSQMDRFEETIADMPEVMECHHIAGNIDFLLKILVGDQEEYKEFVANKLAQIQGVKQIHSYVVLSASKDATAIDIPQPTKNNHHGKKAKKASVKQR